jgi:hypothetical protein
MDSTTYTSLENLIRQFEDFPELYRHRLIVLVQGVKQDDQFSLKSFALDNGYQYINVNLELSKQLLEIPQHRHPLKAFRLLSDEIVGRSLPSPAVLEHIEILFEPELEIGPVDCLLQIARHRIVLARWKGTLEDGKLAYAEPGHPEYCLHSTEDIQVISLE